MNNKQKELIQAKIKSKKDKILTLQKEVKELEQKLVLNNINASNYIYIPEIDKEVEIEVHDKNKSWDELKEQYGDNFESMLLTKQECEIILKNPEVSKLLKMDGSSRNDDFFIQQFNEENKKRGYVAGFYVGRVRSGFYSLRYSCDADDFRGVRFVRKKVGVKK